MSAITSNSRETIRAYKKAMATPARIEWKRKWSKYIYQYGYAVAAYEIGDINFKTFMEQIEQTNKLWREDENS